MAIFRGETPRSERSDRSAGDRLRHRQKVRQSIRENIADIIAEESIIGKDKDRVVRVPLRGIKEYRFVYGENEPGTGQGDGSTQPGQVVGKVKQEGKEGQDRGGDKPGQDYYETDVTIDELVDIMFEDLELPNMERKALRRIESLRMTKRKGYRSVGIRVRLDKRRTVRNKLRRERAADPTHAREREIAEQLGEAIVAGNEEKFREAQEQARNLGALSQKQSDILTGKKRKPFPASDPTSRHVKTASGKEA